MSQVNVRVEDRGTQGIIDSQDRIVVSRSCETPTNCSDPIEIYLSPPADPEKQARWKSKNLALLGLEDPSGLSGLRVATFESYEEAYQELKAMGTAVTRDPTQFAQRVQAFIKNGRRLAESGEAIAQKAVNNLELTNLQDFTDRVEIAHKFLELEKQWGIHAETFPSLGVLFEELKLLAGEDSVLLSQVEQLKTEDQTLRQLAKQNRFQALSERLAKASETALHVLRLRQIAEIEKFIEQAPTHPTLPDRLFRLAELYRAEAEYQRALAISLGAREEALVTSSGLDPTIPLHQTYQKAINTYQSILQDHPSYSRMDEVMYRWGEMLLDLGKNKWGATYMLRLTKEYPKSKWVTAAYLYVANYYRDADLIFAARSNYLKAFEDRHSSFSDRIKYDLILYILNPNCRELMAQGEWIMSASDDNFKEISFSLHNNRVGWESVLEVLRSVNPEKI
ncbi:MAG: hypothetical protein HYU97_06000 [Deltaproteobacteria bacterium]|nr:hypothetical protein [Deltaproteobacteria bacterium]